VNQDLVKALVDLIKEVTAFVKAARLEFEREDD
jgi:hypothetical protein